MTDGIEPSGVSGGLGEQPAAPGRGIGRKGRRIAAVIVAVCLVGGGVGTAVAVSGGSGGSPTPVSAVTRLLAAADHSDLLGALDAIVPGERAALEPGMTGFVDELGRLNVLSHSLDLSSVGGMSFQFKGVTMSTTTLSPTLVAVRLTGGSVTGTLDARKLPIGSFVSGLVAGRLPQKIETSTGAVSTGREAIVTENVSGTWYVSLGYTIAYDALTSAGRPASPPASGAVVAVGASTPEGAVRALLDDTAAFNLGGVLSDLPPGEIGALQSYAPLFVPRAGAELAHARSLVTVKITSLALSSSAVAGGTFVKVGDLGLSVKYHGETFGLEGGCLTVSTAAGTARECPSKVMVSKVLGSLIAAFPPSLRPLLDRLTKFRPAVGFVTVQENGQWFVSPVLTMSDEVNGFLAVLQPGGLVAFASFLENHAQEQRTEQAIMSLFSSELAPLAGSL